MNGWRLAYDFDFAQILYRFSRHSSSLLFNPLCNSCRFLEIMAVINFILTPWALLLVPAYLVLYYIVPYFTTYAHLQGIKGPLSAKFSNIWLAFGARRGQKFAAVDWAHRKYGKIVRVGFNHVSIADERALQVVYGHGNGFLKEYILPRTIQNWEILLINWKSFL